MRKIINIVLLVITIILSVFFIGFQIKGEVEVINIPSTSYYLDGYDLVFTIEIESNQGQTGVDLTLRDNDTRTIIDRSSSLSWKCNTLLDQQLQETTVNSFQFRLFIKESTSIPSQYILSIKSDSKEQAIPIRPFNMENEELEAGGGASISAGGGWELSDYEILDNTIYKGEEVRTRSLVTNYYFTDIGPIYMNFEFTEDNGNYDIDETRAFSGYGYNTGEYVAAAELSIPPDPGVSVIDVDIPWYLHPGANEYYAFNTGEYTSDKAIAYFPGSTRTITGVGESLDVDLDGTTHPVYVVHLRDSYFTSEFGSGNWMDAVETEEYYVTSEMDYFDTEEYFGIDFYSLQLSWTPNQYDLQYLSETQVASDAKNKLGLSQNWMTRTGSNGVHTDNHGFDLLIGSSGKPNYVDSGEVEWSCASVVTGNRIVTMDGWVHGLKSSDYDSDKMRRATLHEVFHSYSADHINNWGYIMQESIQLGGWILHSFTEDDVEDYITHFDGPH